MASATCDSKPASEEREGQQAARIIMGACWAAMGSACVLAPDLVLKMSINPKYLSETGSDQARLARILMQCFGSQAVCCGALMLLNPMSKASGLAWTGALVPYFVFDYVFWREGVLTDFGALGDAVGNTIFAACSLRIADVL